MDEKAEKKAGLAGAFEEKRGHLRAVAYRMLGSKSEAEDAVQEAWLRLSRTETSAIANLGGWLTTVVARVCLDMLRSRKTRGEEPLVEDRADVSAETDLADAVGPALLVVLDTLAPAERLAFVLHDLFGVAFEEIARIVGKTPAAARQLASRARRRVRGAGSPEDEGDARQREIVDAFLLASRSGDFKALLAVLDPDVVVRADATVVSLGSAAEVRGANDAAKFFGGRARGAKTVTIDGMPGAAWMPEGQVKVAFDFTITDGRIVAIDLIGDPDFLAELAIVPS